MVKFTIICLLKKMLRNFSDHKNSKSMIKIEINGWERPGFLSPLNQL